MTLKGLLCCSHYSSGVRLTCQMSSFVLLYRNRADRPSDPKITPAACCTRRLSPPALSCPEMCRSYLKKSPHHTGAWSVAPPGRNPHKRKMFVPCVFLAGSCDETVPQPLLIPHTHKHTVENLTRWPRVTYSVTGTLLGTPFVFCP